MSPYFGCLFFCFVTGWCAVWAWLAAAEPPKIQTDSKPVETQKSARQAALAPLQSWVGGWKGVGQPRRGSTVGAWSETADVAWAFPDTGAELRIAFTNGKYFSQWRITPADKPNQFVVTALLPDGKTARDYLATLDEQQRFVAESAPAQQPPNGAPVAGEPQRVTIKTAAGGERWVMLYEARTGEAFTRLAEVGATRIGGNFAAGAGGPECVVTGGLGTIAVTYEGKTYYVCCTGCKEAFDADPAGILAEYAAKREKK